MNQPIWCEFDTHRTFTRAASCPSIWHICKVNTFVKRRINVPNSKCQSLVNYFRVGGHAIPQNRNIEVEHLYHAWTPDTVGLATPQACRCRENHTIKCAQPWLCLFQPRTIKKAVSFIDNVMESWNELKTKGWPASNSARAHLASARCQRHAFPNLPYSQSAQHMCVHQGCTL